MCSVQLDQFNDLTFCSLDSFFNGTARFFYTLPLIIEGSTKKVLTFVTSLKSICNKNFCFEDQKCSFKHCRMVEPIHFNFLKDVLFTFSELPAICSLLHYIKMHYSIMLHHPQDGSTLLSISFLVLFTSAFVSST
jgi:hypothetical protein